MIATSTVCFCSRTDCTVSVNVAAVAAVLPARSSTEPDTVVVPSATTTTSAGHAPVRDTGQRVGAREVDRDRARVVRRPLSGARSGAAVIVGLVRSTLTGPTVAVAPLPATSVAVPVTDWFAPSPKRRAARCTTPDPRARRSTRTAAETAALYQPLAFGAALSEPVIVGGVLSMLTAADAERGVARVVDRRTRHVLRRRPRS